MWVDLCGNKGYLTKKQHLEIKDGSRQYPCWNNLARAANQNVLGLGDHEEPELQIQGQFSEFLKWLHCK